MFIFDDFVKMGFYNGKKVMFRGKDKTRKINLGEDFYSLLGQMIPEKFIYKKFRNNSRQGIF